MTRPDARGKATAQRSGTAAFYGATAPPHPATVN